MRATTLPATCHCLECEGLYAPRRQDQQFCSSACRAAWNNRRASRGAMLYDFWMEFRIRRGKGLFRLLCALSAAWRAEDRHDRAGRQSWIDPTNHIQAQPWITAHIGRI